MIKMPRVVIAGGGFAGISAARVLAMRSSRLEVTLVDPRENSVFLPLLPDVVSGRVGAERLLFSLPRFSRRWGIKYVRGRAKRIESGDKLVLDDDSRIAFDFLLICAGGKPRLVGDARLSRLACTLYGIRDARRLAERAEAVAASSREHNFVVVGGGYTGVETATALAYRLRERRRRPVSGRISIRIVEMGPAILGGLPDSVAEPVRREVERMGIQVSVSSGIGEASEEWVEVGGEKIGDHTLVWSAGVETVDFVRTLDFPKDGQGRLLVEGDLRLPGMERVYALGDSACFRRDGRALRMAIQFSLSQGSRAGRSIFHQVEGKAAGTWRPRDLGYLVPLSSGKAWGFALGRPVGGRLGSFLHYFMCVTRTFSHSNRCSIIRDLIFH